MFRQADKKAGKQDGITVEISMIREMGWQKIPGTIKMYEKREPAGIPGEYGIIMPLVQRIFINQRNGKSG